MSRKERIASTVVVLITIALAVVHTIIYGEISFYILAPTIFILIVIALFMLSSVQADISILTDIFKKILSMNTLITLIGFVFAASLPIFILGALGLMDYPESYLLASGVIMYIYHVASFMMNSATSYKVFNKSK